MRIKLYIVLALLCGILIMPQSVTAEPLKIGVFDVQKVMSEAHPVKTYRQRYQDTLDLKRKPLEQTEEELRQLKSKIDSKIDKGGLKPDEAAAAEFEFAKKSLTAKHQREDLDAEIMVMDRWLKAQVYKDISEVLEELNKKEDYSVILERSVVAYYKRAVDITGKIIELYNKKKQ